MNCCTEEDLRAFDAIPFRNKLCFTALPRPELACAVHFPGYNEREVLNDTDYYSRYIDLEEWLNAESERYLIG